jgi:hypothetical protein
MAAVRPKVWEPLGVVPWWVLSRKTLERIRYYGRPWPRLEVDQIFVEPQAEVLSEAVGPRVVRKVVRSCSLIFCLGHRIADSSSCCLLAKTWFLSRS